MEVASGSKDKDVSPSSSPENTATSNSAKVTINPFFMDDSNSSSDTSEFEDVLEVGKHNEDYFEVPRRRKKDTGPPLPTKDLVFIPRDKLVPFKQLYEKQPQKIKEMMRVTFSEAKPVTSPPPLSLFVNRVRKLQERKKHKKQAQKKQLEKQCRVKSQSSAVPDSKVGAAKVCRSDVYEHDTQLVHVDYPGRVVHVDKAIETMGGIGQITKVFNNVNNKLHVRFRPDDPCCNSARGEAAPAVGLLLKVRYRKPVQKVKTEASSSKQQGTRVEQIDDESIVINGVRLSKSQILYEDKQLLKKVTSEKDKILQQHQYRKFGDPGHSYLKIPKNYEPVVDQKIRIETLGIVNRTYKFEGLCDFQYIPSKLTKDGTPVSTRDQLFPLLGNPSEDNDNLFVCDELFQGEDRDAYVDLLPPMMSRIDKPVEAIVEHMLDSDNIKLAPDLTEKSGVISTSRARRNVYTIFYNFQNEKHKANIPVPSEPLIGALEDVKKRFQYEVTLELLKKSFEERPVWSKIALEYELKKSSVTLKYTLPCVSYFATNGPWRALWIRFGYDPRLEQSSFIYQTVDFRVPATYRIFMDELDKIDETFYVFRPHVMPPRGQMFYQVLHLKCEEITRLIEIASQKASDNELQYDIRFGWFKEGTFEYIRHIVTQYIESHLEELGKIPEYRVPKIFLPDDELEPTEKLVSRPRSVKRLRKVRSYKPKPSGAELNDTSTSKSPKKSTSKRKPKGKESSRSWVYQGILEDLSIKEINKYGSKMDKDDEKEMLDDDSLLSDDFEDESATEDSEDLDYEPGAGINPHVK